MMSSSFWLIYFSRCVTSSHSLLLTRFISCKALHRHLKFYDTFFEKASRALITILLCDKFSFFTNACIFSALFLSEHRATASTRIQCDFFNASKKQMLRKRKSCGMRKILTWGASAMANSQREKNILFYCKRTWSFFLKSLLIDTYIVLFSLKSNLQLFEEKELLRSACRIELPKWWPVPKNESRELLSLLKPLINDRHF